jgi:hypothetical protein
MKVGDRVRVIESVVVYHHPEHKSQPFEVKGLEGEVKAFVTEWRGQPIAPTYPSSSSSLKSLKPIFEILS